LLIVDIAVPRDIEPEVNFLEDVYLYNIDDLQAIAEDYLRLRQEEVAQCERIIRGKMLELLESLNTAPESSRPEDTDDSASDVSTAQVTPS
jgi:glutamyl-tRNA reductase